MWSFSLTHTWVRTCLFRDWTALRMREVKLILTLYGTPTLWVWKTVLICLDLLWISSKPRTVTKFILCRYLRSVKAAERELGAGRAKQTLPNFCSAFFFFFFFVDKNILHLKIFVQYLMSQWIHLFQRTFICVVTKRNTDFWFFWSGTSSGAVEIR